MIGLGSEQQIIGEDGKPLYFLLDKRIPVDMDYDKLKPFDEVAYIRFASVYRSFKDAATFQKELQSMVKKTAKRT